MASFLALRQRTLQRADRSRCILRSPIPATKITKANRANELAARLDSGVLEQIAEDFFGFEKFTGDSAGGAALLAIVAIDFAHRCGNFA